MEDCQKISLSEIKKKLNKKSAIIDFFREMGNATNKFILFIGYFYPNFSSFNYNFCLEVLSGKKKVCKDVYLYNFLFLSIVIKAWPGRGL